MSDFERNGRLDKDSLDVLTQERATKVVDTILNAARGGGITRIYVTWMASGSVRWARNFAHTSVQKIECRLAVNRTIRGASALVETNRIDEEGLHDVVAAAERQIRISPESSLSIMNDPEPELPYTRPDIWRDSTLEIDSLARSEIARTLIQPAQSGALSSAGEIRIGAESAVFATSAGLRYFYQRTVGECSMTVRNAAQAASGWAGTDHHDWQQIDVARLNATAIDKCNRSANPKAVEPGRYTAIIEAQAVVDLVSLLFWDPINMRTSISRYGAEMGGEPFSSSQRGYSKIGMSVADERLRLRSDPTDPDAGFLPFDFVGSPFRPIDWISNAKLQALAYDRRYGLTYLGENIPLPNPLAFRLDSQESYQVDLDTMIRSTKRGLLVTRFSGVRVVDIPSALCTGYTRDGVWLIENGKVSYPVKNFQILESPLFMLNNVVQIGHPIRVFRPGYPTIAPTLKVTDFNFASLADAV